MKRFISILLLLATLLSLVLVACDNTPAPEEEEEDETVTEAYHELAEANVRGTEEVQYEIETVEGKKYIYFGMYPQTKVTDTEILSGLSQYAQSLPTASNHNGWTSQELPNEYGVKVTSKPDYSFFKDVKYEGEYYRAMYFTELRIYHPGSVTIPGYEDKPVWGPNCQLKRG